MIYLKKTIKNNKFIYKKYRNIKEIIEKRYNIVIGIVTTIMIILLMGLFYVQIIRKDYYVNKVNSLTQNIVLGSSAPRGRMYDRNGRIIVDNKPVRVIYYNKTTDVTTKKEIEMAYNLGKMIDVDYTKLSAEDLKKFWLKNNSDLGKNKITSDEWKQLEERRITLDDIESFKLERVTEDDIKDYSDTDKEAAYIYKLMNQGYYNDEKIIKKDNITDEEYALVSENIHELIGFNTRLDWERYYPYGDAFKTILGNVSSSESGLPYELKDYYVSKGYSLNDRVGISYLEYQYEDYLKGTKNVYENVNNEQKLITEGKRGNDIVLTIDIELQKVVEDILTSELIKTKSEPNTNYYNRSFVIITDPYSGEILAMAGKQIITKDDGSYQIYDYTPGVTTSPVVVGSVIKGASQIVGYNTGALKVNEIRDDACIKIKETPIKCSWKYLGKVNDITALKYSSNTYQFNTAIKVGGGTYTYDGPLSVNEQAFDIYRNTFAEFGLGVKTGIDLPIESMGYKGSSTLSGHLLDFSIGQYDTYTPMQLSQYIGTIANGGYRLKPYLLKAVYAPTKDSLTDLIFSNTTQVLNKIDTTDEYLSRVKEGFKQVLEVGGTGYGMISSSYSPAGKTGTSQSFVDSDSDGVIDKETITNTFAGYAPYDKPVVSFTIISPDIYYNSGKSTYQSNVNTRITQQVSKKFFEIYQ